MSEVLSRWRLAANTRWMVDTLQESGCGVVAVAGVDGGAGAGSDAGTAAAAVARDVPGAFLAPDSGPTPAPAESRWWYRRQPLVPLACCAVAGIAAAEWVPATVPAIGLATAALAAMALRWRGAVFLFVVGFFWLRHEIGSVETAGVRLAQALGPGPRVVTGEGWVATPPQRSGARGADTRFCCRLEGLWMDGSYRVTAAPVLVQWQGGGEVKYGDRVRVRGELRSMAGPRNPGAFDAAGYWRRRGIHSELRAVQPGGCRLLGGEVGCPVVAVAGRVREWVAMVLGLGLEEAPAEAALIRSMVLGLAADTVPEIEEMFRETGTLHLFAVSGLNVGMFALIAWLVLRPLGLGRRWGMLVVIPVVFGYAAVTGFTPSGVRAAVMAAVMMGGWIAGRRPLGPNAVGAAALGILLCDSNQLFQAGFQMSFGVVIALMAGTGPLGRVLGELGAPDPFVPPVLLSRGQRFLAGLGRRCGLFIATCLTAWLGSLPLSLWYFHRITPVALLANLAAVPLAFVVLATGVLAVVSGVASGWAAAVCNNANWLAAGALLAAVRACAAIPGGHWNVGWPTPSGPVAELVVFDFESGGAIAVRGGGEQWLIDAGRAADGRWTLESFLRQRGVNRLAGVVWTHGDAAHLGGMREVIRQFVPRRIATVAAPDRSAVRRQLTAELAARGIGLERWRAGDRFVVGKEIVGRVLYPPADLRRTAADDQALVILLAVRGVRVLLLSDAGFVTERWLIERGCEVRADVMVRGTHGGDEGGTAAFLDRVRPAVIVAGYEPFLPEWGVPGRWAEAVRRRGCALFCQRDCGAVTVRVWPGHHEVRGFLGDQSFTSRAR